MNLATEPWIPVLLKNGERQVVSLSDVFQVGDQYADLAVRPHERIALMRLLVCIAQAALAGPADIEEWAKASTLLPESAGRYLESRRTRFDLFHEHHPFLQIASLKQTGRPTPVTKLDCALATGNASTLFDHAAIQPGLRSFSAAQMALMLLTYLNFSTSGTISQVRWNGKQTTKSSDDAPCIPSSMYHTFLRCSDLRSSIHANVLTKLNVGNFYGAKSWGRPVWEQMPVSLSDAKAATNATQTYLGRLVPLPRLVLLNRDGATMLLGNGLKYPTYPSGPREPSATAVVFKQERRILGAGHKAIWRQLPALIAKRHGDSQGGALALSNISEDGEIDIVVAAMVRRQAGQADIADVIESVLYVPSGMRTDAGMATYEKEVRYTERVAGRLYSAIDTYYRNLGDDWTERLKREADPRRRTVLRAQLESRATQQYWTHVEKLRPLLIAHVGAIGTERFEQVGKVFRREAHRAARDSYELACGQDNGRQIRAFALGWARLSARVQEDPENGAADLDVPEPQ